MMQVLGKVQCHQNDSSASLSQWGRNAIFFLKIELCGIPREIIHKIWGVCKKNTEEFYLLARYLLQQSACYYVPYSNLIRKEKRETWGKTEGLEEDMAVEQPVLQQFNRGALHKYLHFKWLLREVAGVCVLCVDYLPKNLVRVERMGIVQWESPRCPEKYSHMYTMEKSAFGCLWHRGQRECVC